MPSALQISLRGISQPMCHVPETVQKPSPQSGSPGEQEPAQLNGTSRRSSIADARDANAKTSRRIGAETSAGAMAMAKALITTG